MRKVRKDALDLLNPELAEHRRPTKEEQEDKGNNVTFNERGNSESYTISRLKRDRPDLAERVMSRALSANAAAIEAGFRKRTITVPAEPRAAAIRLLKHFGNVELIAAIKDVVPL